MPTFVFCIKPEKMSARYRWGLSLMLTEVGLQQRRKIDGATLGERLIDNESTKQNEKVCK
jgi:hypothetical protein